MKNQKTKKRNDNKYKVTKKRKYRKKIIEVLSNDTF